MGSQVLRTKGYKAVGDQARYKANNHDLSDGGNMPHKMSVDHSSSVSGIDMRNNPRYRVESGNKPNSNSEVGSGYGISRHGNKIVAPNNSNHNNLSRVYGKNQNARSIVQTNSYRDQQQYVRSMPIENSRGYMNSHLTPAQLRMNAERDNISYQSKGGLSKGSRGLPPLNDHYNYQPKNYQSYKIGLSA